jgi:hypothetical protein
VHFKEEKCLYFIGGRNRVVTMATGHWPLDVGTEERDRTFIKFHMVFKARFFNSEKNNEYYSA